MPPLLKPTQVAMRWSCSLRHVRRLAESGALRGLKVGSLWRFSMEAVTDFEAANTTSAETVQATTAVVAVNSVPVFELPAKYEQRFPHLLGMAPATRAATRKTASQRN